MTIALLPATLASRLLPLAPAPASFAFKAPRIEIGGVPLFAQHVAWDFVPGSAPFRTAFQFIAGPQFERVRVIKNPTTLRIKIDGAINGRPSPFDMTVRQVFLGPPRQVDAFHWLVEASDLRSQWEGHKFTYTANRTWRKNEFGAGLVAADADPARVREEIERFEKFRYLPWSKNPATQLPWTCLQLLVRVLEELCGLIAVNSAVASHASDNGMIRENLEWREEPVQNVLDELATDARVGFGVTTQGIVRVYNLDEPVNAVEVLPLSRPPIGGGVAYQEDNRRIRPKRGVVRFAERREVLLVASRSASDSEVFAPTETPIIGPLRGGDAPITVDDYKTGRAAACYNVVKPPRDVTYRGVTWQKNTWMPMALFLQAIGLTDEEVRKNWFGELLVLLHAVLRSGRDLSVPPDALRYMEAVAVKRSYRQDWMIDPYWSSRWDEWDTRRAALVDPVSRWSLPTPVWADYCVIPSVFAPQHARGFAGWKKRGTNYIADVENPGRTYVQSPAGLTAVDQQMGVLRLDFPVDPESVIDTFVPTGVDNLPEISAAADTFLWQDARLMESHTFEAVVTVTPAVDSDDAPTDKRFFAVRSTDADGEGPEMEWFVAEEVARYPHPQGLQVDSLNDAAKAAAQAGLPANVGLLASLAAAQIAASYSSFRDRLAGNVMFPGADTNYLTLFGPCRGIRVEFSPSRGLTTTYDLTTPLAAPSVNTMLSPAQRRLVYGQLGPEN